MIFSFSHSLCNDLHHSSHLSHWSVHLLSLADVSDFHYVSWVPFSTRSIISALPATRAQARYFKLNRIIVPAVFEAVCDPRSSSLLVQNTDLVSMYFLMYPFHTRGGDNHVTLWLNSEHVSWLYTKLAPSCMFVFDFPRSQSFSMLHHGGNHCPIIQNDIGGTEKDTPLSWVLATSFKHVTESRVLVFL